MLSYSEGMYPCCFYCSISDSDFLCISKAQEREHITYVSSIMCCSKYETKRAEKEKSWKLDRALHRKWRVTPGLEPQSQFGSVQPCVICSSDTPLCSSFNLDPPITNGSSNNEKKLFWSNIFSLLSETLHLFSKGENKLTAVNPSAGISLHLCLSWLFID